jgi:Zn2+/Cd2+-exporting ATPase
MAEPYRFDEFFDSGLEESVSPFLKAGSRRWGKDLFLKSSLLSMVTLGAAFGLSFNYALAPLSWLFLFLTYFLAGIPKLIDTFYDLLKLNVNIDVLMTLAAFLSVLIGSAMEGGLLLVLFAISGSMEETVTSKAKSAVRSLHQLAPSKATVIDPDGHLLERHVRDVTVGTEILIRAGEIVPLDGEVIDGSSSVNMAHLTGETLPATKTVGDEVPAGARNMEGRLTLRVTHLSTDSTLSRIITLITQAQEARPKFQRWLDSASRGYALTIIGMSALFAAGLPFVTSLAYFGEEGSIYRALAFLIAASPCALIIALPVAYLSAISACARRGILLKGGVTLDAMASCSAVAFDKTGTLTTGELRCLGIEPIRGGQVEEALRVAVGLETHAVHPIAQAILSYGKEQGAKGAQLTDFRAIPGYGLEGRVDGKYAYIGHLSHITDRAGDTEAIQREIERCQGRGELISTLLLGDDLYLLRFEDTPRTGVKESLVRLKDRGLRLLMLTGDHHSNAESVAGQIGIDEFYADLRPEEKLEHVTKLSQQQGLAMVGDGINDAPALARATTGISMGRVGSRTAIDASDVVLLQDNLPLLEWLWDKAHATIRVVRQNVALALVAIVVASLSALAGIIPLWMAVLLHEGGTVIVGLNSLRLLR